MNLQRRPYGYGRPRRRPFYGAPFLGGVLGGLLGSTLFGPYPYYPPYGYPYGYGYPFYGGFWW